LAFWFVFVGGIHYAHTLYAALLSSPRPYFFGFVCPRSSSGIEGLSMQAALTLGRFPSRQSLLRSSARSLFSGGIFASFSISPHSSSQTFVFCMPVGSPNQSLELTASSPVFNLLYD
jgi:hypothetical protein